jgi:hypothetical protein
MEHLYISIHTSITAVSALVRYILAPSSLAGRGLGVGFLYLKQMEVPYRFHPFRV